MASSAQDAEPALALPAPTVLVDALPYIDGQYRDPKVQAQVHALIQEEMATFRPERDYLEGMPMHDPTFETSTLLQADWMRVCDGAPMSKIDTARYQLDPPAIKDAEGWRRAVDNARAQLESQGNRCRRAPRSRSVAFVQACAYCGTNMRDMPPATCRLVNLELLQQHGAKLWVAQCNSLDASVTQLERAEKDLADKIEVVNRERDGEELWVPPHSWSSKCATRHAMSKPQPTQLATPCPSPNQLGISGTVQTRSSGLVLMRQHPHQSWSGPPSPRVTGRQTQGRPAGGCAHSGGAGGRVGRKRQKEH